VIFVV